MWVTALAVAVVLGTTAGRTETTALPVTEIASGIFVHAAFRDDHPDFVGHAKLPGALAQRGDYYVRKLRSTLGDEANGTEIVVPTVLVSDKLDLDLGSRRLTLRAHG